MIKPRRILREQRVGDAAYVDVSHNFPGPGFYTVCTLGGGEYKQYIQIERAHKGISSGLLVHNMAGRLDLVCTAINLTGPE